MCPVLILWSLWNLVTRSDFYFWNPKIGWNNMSTAPKREEPCDNKLSICDILGSSGNDKKSLELSVQGALWAGEQDQLVGERHGSPAERLPDLSEQSESDANLRRCSLLGEHLLQSDPSNLGQYLNDAANLSNSLSRRFANFLGGFTF